MDAVFESETIDIGRTGIFLHTTEIHPVGTFVRVVLSVKACEIVLHGNVVRVVLPPLGSRGLVTGLRGAS